MGKPDLVKIHKPGSTSPTAYLLRLRVDNLEQYFRFVEPNKAILNTDLRYLARYMVKFGDNVELAKLLLEKDAEHKNDSEIDFYKVVALTSKYDLTWSKDCHKSDVDLESNKSLYHVAATFPRPFIDVAAGLNSHNFDERRFWYCANNGGFWLKYAGYKDIKHTSVQRRHSPPRLLSEALQVLLTPSEPRLAKVCALRATVRHCDDVVRAGALWANYKWIRKTIKADKWGKSNEKLKTSLRIRYGIKQAEQELQPIEIELFVEWWNLTNLKAI